MKALSLIIISLLFAANPASGGQLNSGSPFPVEQLEALPKLANADGLQLQKNVVVVIFWASWCPYCKKQVPDLAALHTKLQARGLKVVGVSKEDSRMQAQAYAKTLNFPQLYDEGQKLSNAVGINGVPHIFIIGKDGKVITASRGYSALIGKALEGLVGPLL